MVDKSGTDTSSHFPQCSTGGVGAVDLQARGAG